MAYAVPLGIPAFRRLAAGRLLSQLADWLLSAALVGWTYHRTGSTAAVAGLMLLRLAPPLLGGGVATVLVDRLAHRRLLPLLECLRSLAAGLAVGALALDVLPLAAVAVVIAGVLGPFGSVTVKSLVPRLVEPAALASANAVLAMAAETAMVAGALGAGVALSASSPGAALVGVIALALGAAALYRGVPPPLAAARPARTRGSLRAGLRQLRARPVALIAIASFSTATIATGLVNASLPRLLTGRGLGTGAYGFGLAALAGGLMVGELFVGLLPSNRVSIRGIGFSLVLMSAMFVLLGFVGGAGAALLFLALAGIGDGASDVAFQTILQRTADPAHLGAVLGIAQTAMTTTMLGAVALAPALNAVARPSYVVGAAAAVLLAAAAVAFAPFAGDRPSEMIAACGST